jgi:O-acetyl-ADP-ribose deacetylase (regulator of RNase III)
MPVKLFLKQANILDIPADVLVCSANVTAMQGDLHAMLAHRTPRCAQVGEVFVCHTPGLPYLGVLHAVAVDPMYHSTPDVIQATVNKALKIAADLGAQTIALTALASGFGDLSLDGFAEGVRPLLEKEYGSVQRVIIPQIEDYRFQELKEAFPEAGVL